MGDAPSDVVLRERMIAPSGLVGNSRLAMPGPMSYAGLDARVAGSCRANDPMGGELSALRFRRLAGPGRIVGSVNGRE